MTATQGILNLILKKFVTHDAPHLHDIKFDPDGRKRSKNVAEHYHAVRFESAPRLQRELDCDVSCL